MKTAIILGLSLLFMGTLPATSAKRYSDDLYKDIISRHCRVVEHDKQERFHNIPWSMSRSTIKIRSVHSLSGGWLRIYGFGNAFGRQAQGHVDYHPRSQQVRCPTGSWTFGHKFPLLPVWD